MTDSFVLNGDLWVIKIVPPTDPLLVDRTNRRTVATTDPETFVVALSSDLRGDFLIRVFIHELAHCVMVSFGLIDEFHRMLPSRYWIQVEEWVCNFIADYGTRIFETAEKVYGYEAWRFIPQEFNKWVT